jgi:hypothetical protein
VFGMAETNIHWHNSKIHAKDLMYGWFRRSHITYKYYRDFPGSSKHQVGGVLQLAIGDITCRIKESGGDTSGQGRWTWQSFQGKAQQTLRIITAYRPVMNRVNVGSVWHQQQYYADTNDLQGSPHERWLQDLKTALQMWLGQGESIVLMADFNDDIRSGSTVQTLKQLGLVDHLVTHYTNTVPTFARGSSTIDTILMSHEILVEQCGYSRSPSDHLCVWADIKTQQLFDQILQPTPPKIRRLQCGDPRTVKRYNQVLWNSIQQHQLQEECDLLLEDSSLRITQQQRKWEQLDKKLLKMRLDAERQCRKLKMGKVQWSPEFAQHKITLKFWCLTQRAKQGNSIDRKFFRRIARAANLPELVHEDVEQVQEHIRLQLEMIRQYKKKHVRKRETFLEGLAKALADDESSNSNDKEMNRMKYIRLLLQREQQRQSAQIIRHAVAANNNYQQLDHVVFNNDDGEQVTTYDKDIMERQLITTSHMGGKIR